ncbi:hypothetical protein [Thiomicrorhabdus xiamenensis]|uniref:Uncharacterized protein n=1 Tax=Thiomicrorhabdus xiamenensis TaxID=2739063 RepID=A0A7D4SID0_9GAMM|nr:hypothetical protein [Thiomicrorhabdus xiamenensis]QKI89520.1 hypothetical protein HQN79_08060 [Thiomicrorhabdus xiamenensis]
MRTLLATYAGILMLGIASLLTQNHYFANIAGFISAIGFMIIFFKDRPENESDSAKKMRRYWYIVFATGIFFSLIFGSFWNTHMGNMEVR